MVEARPPVSYTVEDAVKLVVVNYVKPEQAILACGLQGELPYTTLHYKVRVAQERGTYNNNIIKLQTKQRKKLGILIDLTVDAAGDERSPNASPITIEDSIASSTAERLSTTMTTTSGASSQETSSSSTKRHRKTVKQRTKQNRSKAIEN